MTDTIKVHIPTGLPDGDGKPAFRAEEFLRPTATIAELLDALAIAHDSISHVVFNGEVVRRELPTVAELRNNARTPRGFSPLRTWRLAREAARLQRDYDSNFERYTLRAGDELHVIPRVAGKNASIILGVVGAVVGVALGPAGWAWSYAAFSAAMAGFAVGSTIGALITPRPRLSTSSDGNITSYAWQGARNEDRAGVPVPVVFGRHRVGIVRIGTFIRRQGEKEKLYMLGLVSKGPINSISDIRINGQPYTNFPGVTVDTRLGGTGQTVIKGFNAVANTIAQSQEITATEFIYTTSAVTNIDAFELLVTLPGLCHTDNKGELKLNTTRYQYRYRLFGSGVGGWSAWTQQVVARSSRATVYDTIRVEGLTPGRYDIDLQFVSADNTDATKDLWKPYLTGVTEERQDTRTYDGYALVAVQAIATENLNGSIPNIDCLVEGMLLETYNGVSIQPAAFTSAGVEVGRSPAWVILKLFRDPDIGLGRWITDAQLDLASFKACADWHKELVAKSASDPTTEPRHLFDVVIDQQMNAMDLIREICSTARLIPVLSGNKWRLVPEKPSTPVQLFTMGNIVKDSFQVQYQRDKTINALDAQFLDETRDYSTNTIQVVSKPAVEQNAEPVRSQPRSFFGVTRVTQVVREGRFDLNKRWYYRKLIQFRAATDAMLLEAGDLFNIQHDLPQWGYGGRVMPDCTTTLLMLDRKVVIEAGKTYELRVRFADGSQEAGEVRTVADGAGEWSALYVTTPFSRTPQEGDLWAFGEVLISTKPFRCVAITRDGDMFRNVSAVEYNEAVENDSAVITTPNYSGLPNFLAPPPPLDSFSAYEEVATRADGSVISTIILQWSSPKPVAGEGVYGDALVERSWDNANWEPLGFRVKEWRWENAPHGATLYFRVTPRSTRAVLNRNGSLSRSLTTAGKTDAPPTPTGLAEVSAEGAYVLTWNDVDPASDYEVRDANPADWKTSTTGFLWRGRAQRFRYEDPESRSKQFFVRTRDAFGNYSVAPAIITATDAAPGAPTITSITRFKNALKVTVAAAAESDVFAIHLHASQVNGFAPSNATLVSQVVGPRGGEFVFNVSASGTWYFKVTSEDWLSNRLNDWVYSAQSSSSIVIVTAVDPGTVTLAFIEDDDTGGRYGTNGEFKPKATQKITVTWTHTDDPGNPPGALVGFQIVIYDSGTSATNPLFQSAIIANPSATSFTKRNEFLGDQNTYTAAVKAIYIDGLTSNYVTSAGQTIPLDTNPNLQNWDDRNAYAFAESFDGAALPTGISFDSNSGAYSYSIANGEIAITKIAAGTAFNYTLSWVLATWAAAYLDSPYVTLKKAWGYMRIKVDTPGTVSGMQMSLQDRTGGAASGDIALIDDGKYHTYRAPFGLTDPSTDSTLNNVRLRLDLAFATVAVGAVIRITAMAVGAESVDASLDGYVNRGLNARNQFDRDPTGGGYFLQSPIRQPGDVAGNQLIVDSNGFFWLRNASGLVTETPYKLGREVRLPNVINGDFFGWEGSGSTKPEIPAPTSSNRARFVVERIGGAGLEASPAGYPVREYYEICEFDPGIGFGFRRVLFEGGTLGTVLAVGPWTNSAGNSYKSALALDSDHSISTLTGDGYFATIMSGTFNNTVTCNYFRRVVWIKVVMPDAKKATGARYYADLKFAVWWGKVGSYNPVSGQLNLSTTVGDYHYSGDYKARCLSDGRTWRFPIISGGIQGNDYHKDYQNVKVDWFSQVLENAAAAPVSCEIERIEWEYVLSPNAARTSAAGTYRLIYLEEF